MSNPTERIAKALQEGEGRQPVGDNRRRHQLRSRVEAAGLDGAAGEAMRLLAERVASGEVEMAQLGPSQRLQLGLYERAVEAQEALTKMPDEYGRSK